MAAGRPCTSALQGVQRSSPNDSHNGSKLRALTALPESWVNDSREGSSDRNAVATPTRRRAAPARTKATAHNGVVSRARIYPLGSLRRSRRAVTLTRLNYTTATKNGALAPLYKALTTGKEIMRPKRSMRMQQIRRAKQIV